MQGNYYRPQGAAVPSQQSPQAAMMMRARGSSPQGQQPMHGRPCTLPPMAPQYMPPMPQAAGRGPWAPQPPQQQQRGGYSPQGWVPHGGGHDPRTQAPMASPYPPQASGVNGSPRISRARQNVCDPQPQPMFVPATAGPKMVRNGFARTRAREPVHVSLGFDPVNGIRRVASPDWGGLPTAPLKLGRVAPAGRTAAAPPPRRVASRRDLSHTRSGIVFDWFADDFQADNENDFFMAA